MYSIVNRRVLSPALDTPVLDKTDEPGRKELEKALAKGAKSSSMVRLIIVMVKGLLGVNSVVGGSVNNVSLLSRRQAGSQ